MAEITLEKVELVKDRTGTSYKEAKEALEAADGNVVDAIIAIEETINKSGKKATELVNETLTKIKEAVAKGNVTRLVIKKEDEVLLNLPVNVGIVGTLLAPFGVVAGVILAVGTKCQIELIKDDGSVVDINSVALGAYDTVKDKGAELADTLMGKGSEVIDSIKERTSKAKDKVSDTANDVSDMVDELWDEAKSKLRGEVSDSDEAEAEVVDKE